MPSGGGERRQSARNAFPGPWAADGRSILAYRAVTEEDGRLWIGDFGFGGFADGLSRDGRQVLVDASNTERDRNQRVIVLPFAGGPGRVIARFAGDPSWNL